VFERAQDGGASAGRAQDRRVDPDKDLPAEKAN
jgi:hypothetical protein